MFEGMNRPQLEEYAEKLRIKNKRLKEVLTNLHFCGCGCQDDNIKAVEQILISGK